MRIEGDFKTGVLVGMFIMACFYNPALRDSTTRLAREGMAMAKSYAEKAKTPQPVVVVSPER